MQRLPFVGSAASYHWIAFWSVIQCTSRSMLSKSNTNTNTENTSAAVSYHWIALWSVSQCTSRSMLSRENQTILPFCTFHRHLKGVKWNCRRLSRTIWILPEEETNLHALVSAFGIHYCSPQRLIWFTEWNDRRMYVFPTHDPQQY